MRWYRSAQDRQQQFFSFYDHSEYRPEGWSLEDALRQLRSQMATAAQKVYDEWDPTDEYDEYAGGGICEAIADAVGNVLGEAGLDVITTESSCGAEHVWLIVRDQQEAFHVDIPYSLYETYRGPFRFDKIEEVKFSPSDIDIFPADPSEIPD